MSGQIINDYLGKYPSWMPSHTLASLIFKENSNHFDDKEQIRTLIRYYRGKLGNVKSSNKDFHEEYKRTSINFIQPPTWVEEKVVYCLPIGIKKMGFISDLQVPFHDPKAIDICSLSSKWFEFSLYIKLARVCDGIHEGYFPK